MSAALSAPKSSSPAKSSAPTGNRPPAYSGELADFHAAFADELAEVLDHLPLSPAMQVLDVCCGDGFFTRLFAERLSTAGSVVGFDINRPSLRIGERQAARSESQCALSFVEGTLDRMPFPPETFDLVWCAQNLFTLPEPVSALRKLRSVTRPGGIVAVLENDTLHQLLLPWPAPLEIALRAAECQTLCQESGHPEKYYVGRELPQVLAAAGLEPLGFETQSIDRVGPLAPETRCFAQAYLQRLSDRVAGNLPAELAHRFARLIDPHDRDYILTQPHLTLSWVNVLAWGRRPRD